MKKKTTALFLYPKASPSLTYKPFFYDGFKVRIVSDIDINQRGNSLLDQIPLAV